MARYFGVPLRNGLPLGLGSSIGLGGAGGPPAPIPDEYFEYTTLLLPGNGTNGAQNNTFLDSSTNAFSITRNGNTTQGTFSPFSQTGWGNYFSGSSTFVSAPANAAFSYGTGDYTYEAWIYPTADGTATTYRFIMGAGASGQGDQWNINNAGNRTLVYGDGANVFTTTNQFVLNAWNHIALSRNSGTLRIFINGVLGASGASTTNITLGGSQTFYVGNRSGGADSPQQAFVGYMSNVRVLKGVGLYTANFTPPTTPLTAISGTSLLTCQSNRFVDNSSNNFTISRGGDTSVQAFSPFNPTAAWSAATYGGSGYFDGSGDYLTIANNSSQTLASNYTLEFWVYRLNNSDQMWVGRGDGSGSWGSNSGQEYLIYIASNTLYYQFNTGGGVATISTATLPALNQWTHIAIARNGTTTRVWVNGASVGTSTTTVGAVTGATVWVGTYNAGAASYYYNGYITNIRFVQNAAVYDPNSATITVPTAPLTAIANTSYLLNFTNAGIYDATSKNDLETVGNAQISTTQSKFGGSSIYLDGTGDVLVGRSTPLAALGTGDFTLEFWAYPTNFADFRIVWDNRESDGSLTGFAFGFSASNTYLYTAGGFAITGSLPNLNAWNHVALVRFGNGHKIYVNGAQVGSTYTAANNYSNQVLTIGQYFGTGNNYQGYLQDFRITRGIARYTAAFTPPTTAFPVL